MGFSYLQPAPDEVDPLAGLYLLNDGIYSQKLSRSMVPWIHRSMHATLCCMNISGKIEHQIFSNILEPICLRFLVLPLLPKFLQSPPTKKCYQQLFFLNQKKKTGGHRYLPSRLLQERHWGSPITTSRRWDVRSKGPPKSMELVDGKPVPESMKETPRKKMGPS